MPSLLLASQQRPSNQCFLKRVGSLYCYLYKMMLTSVSMISIKARSTARLIVRAVHTVGSHVLAAGGGVTASKFVGATSVAIDNVRSAKSQPPFDETNLLAHEGARVAVPYFGIGFEAFPEEVASVLRLPVKEDDVQIMPSK